MFQTIGCIVAAWEMLDRGTKTANKTPVNKSLRMHSSRALTPLFQGAAPRQKFDGLSLGPS